jgi:elongation factor P
LDGQLMKVLDWTHIKMARGSAQVRMKMQNVRKGDITERTFQAGTRWPRARVDQRRVQYLYSDGDSFHFMDSETYDQFAVSAAHRRGRGTSRRRPRLRQHVPERGARRDLPVTVDLIVIQTIRALPAHCHRRPEGGDLETGLVAGAALRQRGRCVDTRTGST